MNLTTNYIDCKQHYTQLKALQREDLKINMSHNSLQNGGSNKKQIIVHVAGPSGSGKTYLGNKLKEKYGDNIVVMDLDNLWRIFKQINEQQKMPIREYFDNFQKNYQEYIYQFIDKNNNKPIIFVGINSIINGENNQYNDSLEKINMKPPFYFDLKSTHNFYIKMDTQKVIEQKFNRQFNRFCAAKDDFLNELFKDEKNARDHAVDWISMIFNVGKIVTDTDNWNKFYEKLKYKIKTQDKIFKEISKIIDKIVNKKKPIVERTQKREKYVLEIDTYDDYLKFVDKNIGKDCQWIYDIIDKKTTTDRVLLEEKNFVLVTEMNMKKNDLNTFHLLAFPKDKSIRSIRDLEYKHIPLLKEIDSKGKQYISEEFKINKNEIETHFHYRPGVMLLHIHFELANIERIRRPLREHSVVEIIENLLIDSDYYKKVKLQILTKK